MEGTRSDQVRARSNDEPPGSPGRNGEAAVYARPDGKAALDASRWLLPLGDPTERGVCNFKTSPEVQLEKGNACLLCLIRILSGRARRL